jgi:hypothetical protein
MPCHLAQNVLKHANEQGFTTMKNPHGEYRRHPRTGIKIPVALNFGAGTINASTLDVSHHGLSLEKPTKVTPRPGEIINVRINSLSDKPVPATVVHVDRDHIGLRLNRTRLSDNDIENIVQSAPFWQRTGIYLRRTLRTQGRRMAVLASNTLLRPMILRSLRPSFLFAVYGSEKDVRTYYSPVMSRLLPNIIIGGVIRNQQHKGLLVGSKYLESELQQNSEMVRSYLAELRESFPNTECIALVGRLPNFAMKAGVKIEPPLVDGSLGTRYMIWDAARQMKLMDSYHDETGIVVLGGAGRIGSLVCEDLLNLYPTVVAFDPRYTTEETQTLDDGVILRTAAKHRLGQYRLFVGLTHHGDVIGELADFLPKDALIADDTHPCISLDVRERLAQRGVKTLKIVLSHEHFSIWPRMPAWNARDIPGCLVEALVLLDHDQDALDDFATFRHAAEQTGFQGRLVSPPDD